MSLFKWFRSKEQTAPEGAPELTTTASVVEEVNPSVPKETKDNPKENIHIYSINYGTGMPIDVIYGFLHKDFEEDGYNDALVNSDVKYRETKEGLIRNDLKMLFTRISLRYKSDIRLLDVQIKNAEEQYIMSVVAMLSAKRATYEEHLAEIQSMEERLEADDPSMISMIESYKRGFFKGVAAKTEQFLNNNN